MTTLLVIAILVALIIVHEMGHFVAAKLSRVKVQEFGIGYPPRAFLLGTWGGTAYTINWILFGGFVRLFGDEGEAERGVGSFMNAAKWKQAFILAAGVAMNAVAAWLLFAGALHLGVPQVVEASRAGEHARVIVSDVVAGSPAAASGLAAGDEITELRDKSGTALSPLTPDMFADFVRARPGEAITLSYTHEGVAHEVSIIPAQGVLAREAGRPAVGVALALVATRPLPWGEALVAALPQTGHGFAMVFRDVAALARTFLSGAPDLSQVVGPVGIVSYVGEASQNGYGAVLGLAAVISINLAIINLIPIPALDGGRLFILAVETLTRRSAPRLAVQILNALGVALIIFLMVTVTYQDIARLLA